MLNFIGVTKSFIGKYVRYIFLKFSYAYVFDDKKSAKVDFYCRLRINVIRNNTLCVFHFILMVMGTKVYVYIGNFSQIIIGLLLLF